MNVGRRLAALLALAAMALLLLGAGSAFAATESIDVHDGGFGSATSTPPNPYPLGTPGGSRSTTPAAPPTATSTSSTRKIPSREVQPGR